VKKVCTEAKKHFGFCHIVINNAGILQKGNFTEINENLAMKVMQVNSISHMWIVKEFIYDMIDKNEG